MRCVRVRKSAPSSQKSVVCYASRPMNAKHNTFNFLESLNDAQRTAVTAPLGVQMIVAGAGSGKTRVIASRIAYLLSTHGVPASSIIALTFTNKAGNEMKERIKSYLPGIALPFVGTFHSYCVKLLRQHSSLLPFSSFSILDTEDQRSIIKKIMETHGVEKHITPAKMQGMISLSKNHLPHKQPIDLPTAPFFKEVLAAYEKEKARSHAYDFDDLLVVTLSLLKNNPALVARLQDTIRHILVDEYQDTNQIQHELLKTLAFRPDGSCALQSLCAVGDQDQSIYSWRGAQADNMQHFCQDFAPVTVTTIEQNYRSVKPILEAANSVIAGNRGRIEKKLWSAKEARHRILSLYCQSGSQEAQAIAQTLQLAKQKWSLNDMAILYRTHHQSRPLEEALMLSGIPYTIVGGLRFYERKEIKDILAYAKLLVNPFDRQSFWRIINTPARGVGEKCLETLEALWQKNPFADCQTLLGLCATSAAENFSKAQVTRLTELGTLLSLDHHTTAASTLLDTIVQRVEYASYLRKNYEDQELTTKLENVQELLNGVRAFEQEHPQATLPEFLEHVLLMQEHETADSNEVVHQVKLMTLHSAKGLEFELVVLCGLEEQLFPSARSLHSQNDLEEERRLMYVGITRAREHLLLTHSALRTTYGTSTYQEVSRFVKEIPLHLIEHGDVRLEPPYTRGNRIAEWLGLATAPRTVQTYGKPATASPKTHSSFVPYPAKAVAARPSITRSATATTPTTRAPWLVRMPVKHETFGVGLIQEVEYRSGDEYFLTISFKSGTKKLSSRFVRRS